jgi:hypothetical protein
MTGERCGELIQNLPSRGPKSSTFDPTEPMFTPINRGPAYQIKVPAEQAGLRKLPKKDEPK